MYTVYYKPIPVVQSYVILKPALPIYQYSNITQASRISNSTIDSTLVGHISRKIESIESRITQIQKSLSPNHQSTYFNTRNDRSQVRTSNQKKRAERQDSKASRPSESYYQKVKGQSSAHQTSFYKKLNKNYIFNGSDTMYEGNYDQNGLRSGLGSLFDANGKLIYTGEWKEDMFWGKGKLIFQDEKVKNLQLKMFTNFNNVKLNRDTYSGNFIKGILTGIGQMVFFDQNKKTYIYYGNFQNGVFHGNGVVISESNQDSIEGEWINGILQQDY
ncbi:hypothetical protein pb186bvf_008194 [Paramecium bursaria]